MRFIELFQRRRAVLLPLGVGVYYAEKNGRAVLRSCTPWTKICGFWINTPWWCLWLRFRRFPR